MRNQSFHELPLAFFTTLAIAGAGMAVARPAERVFVPVFSHAISGLISVVLIGAGLTVSLLHLGKVSRSWRALVHIGRSPLSTEVAIALAAIAASLSGNAWIAAIGGLALLISVGRVYRIRGQSAWGWEAGVCPLILGTAFGLALQFADASRVVLALLCFDLVLSALRWHRINKERARSLPAHPELFAARRWIAVTRAACVTILPAAALAFSDNAAGAVLAAGILVDRFAFYALALQQTTEAEVARVERVWSTASNARHKTTGPVRRTGPSGGV